jgi:hypothetical protein
MPHIRVNPELALVLRRCVSLFLSYKLSNQYRKGIKGLITGNSEAKIL